MESDFEILPVIKYKATIINAIRNNQIIIIVGQPGSGKTTQIPQFVVDDKGDISNNILPLLSNKDYNEININDNDINDNRDNNKANKNKYKMIAVTQPRRIAATSVAKRVADERKQNYINNSNSNSNNNNNINNIGGEVGYTVRFDDMTSSNTRLKYMTDGVLVRECLYDPLLSKYSVIMLDEAHER